MRIEKVYMTPLVDADTYGSEIDVSDYVRIDGIAKIKRSIDSTDYSIGVYRFGDLRLNCENSRGIFNENDYRSIFPFSRDKTKVRVVVLKINPETLATVTKTQFEGIINDDATRQNITDDVIRLTALSKDSVFRTTQVSAGIVTSGMSVKNALFVILSQPSISNLLTVDTANINPVLNYAIDTPSKLDNLKVQEALDLLMVSSGSILFLESDTIYIQGREKPDEDEAEALQLRGRGNLSNNSNIISVSEYNSGRQRQFNSIRLNDGAVVVEDSASVSEYGTRQIEFDFPFVTSPATLRTIGAAMAEEFRYQKIELKLRVPTEVSENYDLLDLARVDAPLLKKPKPNNFLPIYGAAVYGDPVTPYPDVFGSVSIHPNIKFKIIEIEDDPRSFITTLKLRQYGKFTNDGYFETFIPAVYGTGVYGQSAYGVL